MTNTNTDWETQAFGLTWEEFKSSQRTDFTDPQDLLRLAASILSDIQEEASMLEKLNPVTVNQIRIFANRAKRAISDARNLIPNT